MNLVTRTTFSCQGCKIRHVGCHSTCKIHKEEKEKYNNDVAKIKKAKQNHSDIIGFFTMSMLKTQKKPVQDRIK